MRPRDGARVVRQLDGLRQVVERAVRVALHQVDAPQQVECLRIGGIGLQRGIGKLACAVQVALHQLALGQVQAAERARRVANDVSAGACGQEVDLLVVAAFAFHVHAVDHLAHIVLDAGAFLLHLAERAVEVIHQHPSLSHVQIDPAAAHLLGLAVVGGHLCHVTLLVDALPQRSGLHRQRNAHVHGLRLHRLDQALGHQRHDVALIGELQRRLLHRLQQR